MLYICHPIQILHPPSALSPVSIYTITALSSLLVVLRQWRVGRFDWFDKDVRLFRQAVVALVGVVVPEMVHARVRVEPRDDAEYHVWSPQRTWMRRPTISRGSMSES